MITQEFRARLVNKDPEVNRDCQVRLVSQAMLDRKDHVVIGVKVDFQVHKVRLAIVAKWDHQDPKVWSIDTSLLLVLLDSIQVFGLENPVQTFSLCASTCLMHA